MLVFEPWGKSLGASERGNLAPDFWLQGRSRDFMKSYEKRVLETDGKGNITILTAGSARGRT